MSPCPRVIPLHLRPTTTSFEAHFERRGNMRRSRASEREGGCHVDWQVFRLNWILIMKIISKNCVTFRLGLTTAAGAMGTGAGAKTGPGTMWRRGRDNRSIRQPASDFLGGDEVGREALLKCPLIDCQHGVYVIRAFLFFSGTGRG